MPFFQFAQINLLIEAQGLVQEKKYDQAFSLLDKVILHKETKYDPLTWNLRAIVYYQLYKQSDKLIIEKTVLLDSSISSALRSIKLDTLLESKENNYAIINNCSKSFYNTSKQLLSDSLVDISSESFYLKYKKYFVIANPNMDFKPKDIEYYNKLGGVYADLYAKHDFDQKYGEVAKSALMKVLELDAKNISANINLGILFYNYGASLMSVMDYDIEPDKIDLVQENAKKLFKQSLPFMIKVYELNPKDLRVLDGLEGIYHALYEEDKELDMKKQKEALKK